jgi:TorA maturation chaperone TorD
LKANPAESNRSRVQRVYRLLFSRPPEESELKLALEFLKKPDAPEMTRWEEYAQLLLASNEMLYVD